MALDAFLKNNPRIKNSDYAIFEGEERKKIILAYVNHISSLGYKPERVFGEDMYDIGVSFRATFSFMKPIENEPRKHTAFFEARDYSDFSLRRFRDDVLETTEIQKLNDFNRALKIRLWNTGFTDEEILSAILPHDHRLKIGDVWKDGKLIIPKNIFPFLFSDMNYRGGGGTNSRVVRRTR